MVGAGGGTQAEEAKTKQRAKNRSEVWARTGSHRALAAGSGGRGRRTES